MKEETFWQVFLRRDNIPVLVVILFVFVFALWLHRNYPGEGAGAVSFVGALMLITDIVCIRRGLNRNR